MKSYIVVQFIEAFVEYVKFLRIITQIRAIFCKIMVMKYNTVELNGLHINPIQSVINHEFTLVNQSPCLPYIITYELYVTVI